MKGGEHQQEQRNSLLHHHDHRSLDELETREFSTTPMVSGSITNETSDLPFCSFSTPSTSSSGSVQIAKSTTTPLSQGKKYIDVQLLTREHLYLAVDVKCKIGDIYRYVCGQIGLKCVTLFGLSRFVENEYRFCDQDERLSKFAPTKNWQKAAGWGTDLVGNPSVILYLRVHTYVDYVRLINCPVSLLHYYLQLRENVRIQWEPSWVPEERCFEAASLALQADFGDYRPDKHVSGYFRPDAYFPLWVVNGRGLDYVLRHVPSMHHDLEGLDQLEARIRYCREASMPPCPVNMHLYRLRRVKTDIHDTVYLGVTARGLELFEQKSSGDRHHLTSFVWSKIGKLAFDRKKFTLTSLDGQKIVFYTSSDEKSRYLLSFCRTVHQNIIRLQPAICEARKREADERKQFRESYIYSDTADLDWVRKTDGQLPNCGFCEYTLIPISSANLPLNKLSSSTANSNGPIGVCCGGGGGQRVSLVSDASSNTTSGIVSDRQHTHDDSENENDADVDLEITTGCDSSPLVSELSLATTGTSPALFTNGSQQSQQSSPVYESKTANECGNHFQRKRETTNTCQCQNEGDDDPGECSSSLGPSSDRTVTAAADDTQSTETTSTTGKLEDLCTESELASNAAGTMDDRDKLPWFHAHSSPRLAAAMMKTSTPICNGGISIAELRRLTLQDYADRQPSPQRRASPPILPPPQPMPLSMDAAHGQNGLARCGISFSTQTSETSMPVQMQQENIQTAVLDDANNLHGSPWALQRPKAYRIVSSQVSNENIIFDLENRTTPSPPRTETMVVEPPPPPPYPCDYDIGMENNIAQSYSLSNLTSSSSSSFGLNGNSMPDVIHQQAQAKKHLQRTSMDALPNYEQALQYKAELGRRMTASTTPLDTNSNVPWLHTSVSRRWPTVSGIHPAVLDQLVTAMGARRLQQAQSEPGLAGSSYGGNAENYPMYRRCCNDAMPAAPFVPYATNGDPVLEGGAGAYRSISTYQLPTSGANLRTCTCHHAYDPPPLNTHQHAYANLHPNYVNFLGYHPPAAPTCTPNGLYVKQPRAQSRTTASNGHRIHDQHSSQLLFNNGSPSNHGCSSKAVARVHSMYEAAKADQVRRSLEYEYYRRFEQQVVQNTRRELRKQQQLQMERHLAHQSLNDTNCTNPDHHTIVNNNHFPSIDAAKNGEHHKTSAHHYCDTCQENHTAGKLDLAQLKDIIRSQNVDLPLMRALCNDHTWTQEEQKRKDVQNDSTAHPLLRQKKLSSPSDRNQQSKKPPNQVANHQERPMTWHEPYYEMQTVGSSSWPPYEFSYEH